MLTPPMGWKHVQYLCREFHRKITCEMVDVIVSSGMRDAGYRYVIIDDNWTSTRDSLGFLTVDSARFPSGLKTLSNYIHSKGLKLGLYSDAGYELPGGPHGRHRGGGLGHVRQRPRPRR